MSQLLLTEIGLVGRPRFLRDRLFWIATAGGGMVAFGIWQWNLGSAPPDDISVSQIVLATVMVYPILEELVFRGALQGWLLSRSWGGRTHAGLTVANVITTSAFTGLHFLHYPPMWAASVAVPSLVFGWFRDRAGTIYPSIVLHVLYNLFYLVAVMSR